MPRLLVTYGMYACMHVCVHGCMLWWEMMCSNNSSMYAWCICHLAMGQVDRIFQFIHNTSTVACVRREREWLSDGLRGRDHSWSCLRKLIHCQTWKRIDITFNVFWTIILCQIDPGEAITLFKSITMLCETDIYFTKNSSHTNRVWITLCITVPVPHYGSK